jgi:hypothetical protein
MARSQSYRDNYQGRGKYAKENEAMLDSECSRTTAWRDQPTQYQCSISWAKYLSMAILITMAAITIGLLMYGGLR